MYKLPLARWRRDRARTADLFELSMASRANSSPNTPGHAQTLRHGRRVIHRPQLFLMDEPFEGVDAVGARLMKDILLDQVRQGATIFLTSHVLEVVERLCERVAIIAEGRVVMETDMADLRTSSQSLEDTFVRVVGAERQTETLDWLS
jgi:ABC-2 type transport system ATP-binding protein